MNDTAKIQIGALRQVLKSTLHDPRAEATVLNAIQRFFEDEAAAGDERDPMPKKQFVVVLNDPEGHLPQVEGEVCGNISAHVLQIPEDSDPNATLAAVEVAVAEYDKTRKGLKMPVHTFSEACESVPAKIFNGNGIWVKTKYPVALVVSDGDGVLHKPTSRRKGGAQ